ncbi:MAG: glycosyltransferase family 39 protein, partial [Candidatus Dormiibacterota bacterium]
MSAMLTTVHERGPLRQVLLGPLQEPWWSRPALGGVLLLSVFLTCWALAINGDANTFYAAATLSGTKSLQAFFFGSLDAGNFISIDKPPLALWIDVASAKVFGFSSWSLLLPQALEGVLTVLVVHRAVRPTFGPLAALVAALTLALTPIAVAVDRGNNPDPLLVLLLTLGAWGTIAAMRSGRVLPLVAGLGAVGLAFDAKMLQADLIVPALVLAWLLGAATPWRHRIVGLGTALAVFVVLSLAWAIVVDAVPSQDRPYVGGSTSNSVVQLALGYNGLGRVFGQSEIISPGLGGGGGGHGGRPAGRFAGRPGATGGATGGAPRGNARFGRGPGGGAGGVMPSAGWDRLLGSSVGGQISWLFPLATLGLLAGWLWQGTRAGPSGDASRAGQNPLAPSERGSRSRLDRLRRWQLSSRRAELLLWAVWLATTVLVFSFAQGIWHPYYTIALGPPLAAVAGIGLVAMVQLLRHSRVWWWLLPAAIAGTCAWSVALLQRSSDWMPWLTPVVIGAGILSLVGVLSAWLLAPLRPDGGQRGTSLLLTGATGLAMLAMLAGPAAYSSTPLSTPISTTFPSAGPAATVAFGGGGPGGLPRRTGGGPG